VHKDGSPRQLVTQPAGRSGRRLEAERAERRVVRHAPPLQDIRRVCGPGVGGNVGRDHTSGAAVAHRLLKHLAERTGREHHRAFHGLALVGGRAGAGTHVDQRQRHACRRRAVRIDGERDLMRRPGQQHITGGAAKPQRANRVLPAPTGVGELLVSRLQPRGHQAIENALLRRLERRVTGQPPQRRHERGDVHCHRGIRRLRQAAIDRFRSRRQVLIERRQVEAFLRVARTAKQDGRAPRTQAPLHCGTHAPEVKSFDVPEDKSASAVNAGTRRSPSRRSSPGTSRSSATSARTAPRSTSSTTPPRSARSARSSWSTTATTCS